jgi:hypothetical protein
VKPGDLVRLTSTLGAVNVGILVEEKQGTTTRLERAQGVPSTMLIWKVLIPEGVYSYLREEGWQIEVLEETCP